jgi:glycerol uptake facilitator-like aquaporin
LIGTGTLIFIYFFPTHHPNKQRVGLVFFWQCWVAPRTATLLAPAVF